MRIHPPFHTRLIVFLLVFISVKGYTQPQEAAKQSFNIEANTTKQVYYPYWIYDGAAGKYITQTAADYAKPESRFSTARMKQTDNIVFFWETGYGDNPETASVGYRVALTDILEQLEAMYAFYRDDLAFVQKEPSLTDQYKMVAFLFYNKEWGTVYGSGADDKVGVVLLYPSRIQSAPYGALAHELGHSFQYMVGADGKVGFEGTAWEMTSQYMLWQFYNNWPTFEGYHVTAFMNQTHLAFMHPDNQYHSPFVLEYWADLHGKALVGNLWNRSLKGEDFVMTYKRLNSLTQEAFNDELFEGVRRFVTWDLKRGNTLTQHANKHTYKLDDIGNGWLQVPASHAPQNYGYNAIRLNAASAVGKEITVDFNGLTEAEGYTYFNKNQAGWRYGFVAYLRDGTRVYSAMGSDAQGRLSFTVPTNTSYLWFVAMGAPAMHWKHTDTNIAQWPYKLRFGNTNLYGKANNPPVGLTEVNDNAIRISLADENVSIANMPASASTIRLYTLDGKQVLMTPVIGTSYSTTLPKGVYVLSIDIPQGNYRQLIRMD